MSNWLVFQLIIKEIKIFAKNRMIYYISLYVMVDSYRGISNFLAKGKQNNAVFSIEQEALLRGALFPLVIFLLLNGYILFIYFRRDRLPAYAPLFSSKPIKTNKIVVSRYIAGTIVSGLFYFIGLSCSVIASKLTLGININLIFFLKVYLLLPLLSIGIWNVLILLLSMIAIDLRVSLPVIFLLWILAQLFSNSFIIEYNKIVEKNIIVDNYLLINRVFWLILAVFLLFLSILIYNKQRTGWQFNIIFKSNRIRQKGSPKDIYLRTSWISETLYSLKIYSGWKILAASFVAIILALIYSILVPGQMQVYLYLGTGEVFLAMLAILGASGISNIEQEKNSWPYLASLPLAENRIFKQKIMVSIIYFLAVYLSYTLCGVIFIGAFIAKETLIFIPTYIFFAAVVLIFSKIFRSTLIGGMTSGVIWFLPVLLGRKFPYWLHPYYYFAEFDHFQLNFLLYNKMILLLISILAVIYVYYSERR